MQNWLLRSSGVGADNADGPHDDVADGQTPLKARRVAPSASSRHMSASTTPFLVVVLGSANGNIAVAAVDHVIESDLQAHVLVVDPSNTACEFAQGTTIAGDDLKFDAAPLVIRNGRLHIPDRRRLLDEFHDHEATLPALTQGITPWHGWTKQRSA
jgi:hypothetical protein